MVWLISSFTNRVDISLSYWENIDSDADPTIDFNLVGLWVFTSHFEPEFVWIFGVKIKGLEAFVLEYIRVVFLVQADRLLNILTVFDEILEVYISFSDHIVALEEVTIKGLNRELVVLVWHLKSVFQSVLEVWLAILVSVVGFSLLDIFVWVEEGSEEYITGAFPVHGLHILSIENTNSDFELFWWSLTDFPYLMIL